MHEGIWHINKDGYIAFVNYRMTEMLGYTVDEIQGKHLFSFMDEKGVEICKHNLERCKKGFKIRDDFEFLKKDEMRLYTMMGISPVIDNGGNYLGAIASVTDISDRKKAEEKLKFRLLIEKAVSNISTRFINVKDLNTCINISLDELGKLMEVSRVYIFEIYESGLKTSNTYEWCQKGVSPQKDNLQNLDCNLIPWWMNKLNENEVIDIFDVAQLPPEAEREKKILQAQDIVSLLVVPMYSESRLWGFMGFDDITRKRRWQAEDSALLKVAIEIILRGINAVLSRKIIDEEKKKTERLLVQLETTYEKLESAQEGLLRREKIATTGTLAAGVAHEIRNPLAIIGMTVQYLQSNLSENDPKRELTEAIIRKVERLDRVTKELSSYGRTINLNIRKHNLNRCLNSNLALIKSKCRIQKIKIKKRYSKLPLIEIDDEQIDKVFFNIMDNAVHAMPKGGILTVSTEFNEGENKVIVKIHNAGPVIKKKHVPHIFDPFYTLKKKNDGTGLGLAIAQSAVLRHNGQINVENKSSGENKGVTFIIRLPLSLPKGDRSDFVAQTRRTINI